MILLLGITLQDYLKEVRKHPDVLSARKMAESYSGRSLKSLFPPQPTLTYNAMFMPGAWSINQPLPLSWPFNAMAAREEERARMWEYVGFENAFLLEAIDTYLGAYFLSEKVRILKEILTNLKAAERSVRELYRTGKADRSSLSRITARIRTVEADLEMAEAELRARRDMLRYFYGRDIDTLSMPELDSLPPLEELEKEVPSSPLVSRLEYERKAANLKKRAALFSLVPTVAPGVLYAEGRLSFSVSLVVPLWLPAYFGNLKEYSRKYEGANLRYEGQTSRLKALISSEYSRYLSNLERERRLREALRELEAAYRSEFDRYRTTATGTTDYLFVENDLLQVRLRVLEARLNAVRSVHRIRAMLGRLHAR